MSDAPTSTSEARACETSACACRRGRTAGQPSGPPGGRTKADPAPGGGRGGARRGSEGVRALLDRLRLKKARDDDLGVVTEHRVGVEFLERRLAHADLDAEPGGPVARLEREAVDTDRGAVVGQDAREHARGVRIGDQPLGDVGGQRLPPDLVARGHVAEQQVEVEHVVPTRRGGRGSLRE
ncbi:MAG: hypothetical protein E6J75_04295, partial [Deltaproteobacteria bacterium]